MRELTLIFAGTLIVLGFVIGLDALNDLKQRGSLAIASLQLVQAAAMIGGGLALRALEEIRAALSKLVSEAEDVMHTDGP